MKESIFSFDSNQLFAPVIASSLVQAIYLRAAQEPGEKPFAEKVHDVQAEVIRYWQFLSTGILEDSQELLVKYRTMFGRPGHPWPAPVDEQ